MAIQAAHTKGCRALIIERTFDFLPNAAAHRYWWLPVRWLMRNRFDSVALLRDYQGPLLQCHGTDDDIVPLPLGKRLYDACPSKQKQFIELEGIGHNDPSPSDYIDVRDAFIQQLFSLSSVRK